MDAKSTSDQITVRRTCNPTPHRGWDYQAWYGDLDLGTVVLAMARRRTKQSQTLKIDGKKGGHGERL